MLRNIRKRSRKAGTAAGVKLKTGLYSRKHSALYFVFHCAFLVFFHRRIISYVLGYCKRAFNFLRRPLFDVV